MLHYLIGIMDMIFGFWGMLIENYEAAYCCFGYAFVLWCVMAVFEYKARKEKE